MLVGPSHLLLCLVSRNLSMRICSLISQRPRWDWPSHSSLKVLLAHFKGDSNSSFSSLAEHLPWSSQPIKGDNKWYWKDNFQVSTDPRCSPVGPIDFHRSRKPWVCPHPLLLNLPPELLHQTQGSERPFWSWLKAKEVLSTMSVSLVPKSSHITFNSPWIW